MSNDEKKDVAPLKAPARLRADTLISDGFLLERREDEGGGVVV